MGAVISRLLCAITGLWAWSVAPVLAQGATVAITPSFGANATVRVRSILDLKFRTVVRQQHDYSCGSAAVATLLTYHYEAPVGEQEVLLAMFEKGNRAAIRREGFSLLDMKQYLDSRGFDADGIYAGLDDLARVGIPAIVLIEEKGYRHFVVVKGVSGREVLVGDPAVGLRVYRRPDFEKIWQNGLVFVIRSRADVARRHFNTQEQWAAIPRAPLGEAVARDTLANVTLLRPPATDF
jgi:uncharacterized protein